MTVRRKTVNKPFYLQLKEVLQEMIEDGTFSPGKELPSEHQIAERYGVHPHTTRAALKLLEKDGFLQIVPRRGAFVSLRNYSEISEDQGFTIPKDKRKKRRRTKIVLREAGPYYAKILRIDPRDELYYFKRIEGVKEPLYLEEVFLPVKKVPRLSELNPDIFPLYEILAQNDILIERTSQRLKISDASKSVRKKLKLLDGEVVLLLERIDFDREGPVVFMRYYVRSEDLAIEVKFKRNRINK